MKLTVSDLISSMAFSHRSEQGISVGIAVVAGVAYMSVGFVRDGDHFNRRLARHILAQRIVSTIDGNPNVKFTTVVENLPEKVDCRSIIREFRKTFKPDPYCNDATFSNVDNKLVTFREILSRDQSFAKIVAMFHDAVKRV